ncbi:TVP38/TMEM64 family protein [Halapricum hydrolyticum]|uniref:VTT domain-containing protein n=1 Tax=Halapricum hydrolyticum TaxID=2979991 RepID=A0AAE3LFV7_9EURY|nr:VTT domain-containing protein [Halapricum hydrolyticum]MCU4718912.1 VTT domain-containing protein [Halapricum hydrolyticum]MCU4727995.1 VTT domain-containing protein [Halapricum hydrolyticum]
MGLFTSAANRRRVAVHVAVVAAVLVGSYLLARQYLPFLRSAEQFRAWLLGFGPWAPVMFVAVQALQVVVAPIPGQVVGVASGYVFGVWYGTLYSMIGTLIGTTFVFVIARRYGRPYVERFVAPEWIDRFDTNSADRGAPLIFGFFLIPGLPDDVICFVAGITKISMPYLVVLAAVGRFPSILLFNLAGSQVADDRIISAVTLLVALLVVSTVALYYRDTLIAVLRRERA